MGFVLSSPRKAGTWFVQMKLIPPLLVARGLDPRGPSFLERSWIAESSLVKPGNDAG